jgi:hypothetical protein
MICLGWWATPKNVRGLNGAVGCCVSSTSVLSSCASCVNTNCTSRNLSAWDRAAIEGNNSVIDGGMVINP